MINHLLSFILLNSIKRIRIAKRLVNSNSVVSILQLVSFSRLILHNLIMMHIHNNRTQRIVWLTALQVSQPRGISNCRRKEKKFKKRSKKRNPKKFLRHLNRLGSKRRTKSMPSNPKKTQIKPTMSTWNNQLNTKSQRAPYTIHNTNTKIPIKTYLVIPKPI